MKIDKNDIILLSDNQKYLVLSKVEYRGNIYFYLVDLLDNYNIKIVKLVEEGMIEVKDKTLLEKLFMKVIVDLK